MSDALLAIGTRKGLFLARSTGGGPCEVEPIRFSPPAGVRRLPPARSERHLPDVLTARSAVL